MKRVNEPDLTEFELRRQGYDVSQSGNTRAVTVGAPQEICRVQVGEDAARPWVVTLGPLAPTLQRGSEGVPQIINDAGAVVEWGVGKGRSSVVVDWNRGQQFTVFGSYVSVRGQVASLGAAAVGPDAVTMMSAFIAPGHTSRMPVRTVDYGIIEEAELVVLPVPSFAHSVSVAFVVPLPAGDQQAALAGLVMAGSFTPSLGTAFWAGAPGIESEDGGAPRTVGIINSVLIELPRGTNFITMRNDSVEEISALRLRYRLAL